MKINVLQKVGEQEVEETVIIPTTYDDDGNVLEKEHTETITKTVPIMQSVTRDMTTEEEQEYLANQPQEQQETKEDLLAQMQELMNRYKALEN